jgi:hypothetical protein
MRKNGNPAAAAAAGGAGGCDLAGRQIGPVRTPERQRLQDQRLVTSIRIDVAPMAHGKWQATFNGKMLCTAAAPMVKAARILIAKGFDPSCIIELWHEHAAVWALRGQLGVVAAVILDGERKATQPAKNSAPARFPRASAISPAEATS